MAIILFGVVIPLRGFRCFTLRNAMLVLTPYMLRCNPLAGI